ncbi:MAG TPA: pinensin family lanthipeptide [Longimicrobium sp.]|jgi:hypothetical protein|uniref:pinensin family lanthipeptide n=1 Tax=Longimicrobium sp. TaxID=2029185 RepID=UPI002EDA17D4
MKKLKLDELQVASFETATAAPEVRGTVRGNAPTLVETDCAGTRWDCSIDMCSHSCPLTTSGQTTWNY